MKNIKLYLLIVYLLLALPSLTQAQDNFSITAYGGVSWGAYELSHAGLGQAKAAFRINVSYTIIPVLDAYVGYNRASFSCEGEEAFCQGEPVDFTGAGLNVGLRVHRRADMPMYIPWLRAGLVYQTMNISQGGDTPVDYATDAGLGFEVGAGFTIPVSDHIRIVPSFNYMRYTVTNSANDESTVVVLSGLAGIKYSF